MNHEIRENQRRHLSLYYAATRWHKTKVPFLFWLAGWALIMLWGISMIGTES